MIDAPQMLMLGSSGRDSGETAFACALLKKTSPHSPVVAAKVTTISRHDRTDFDNGKYLGVSEPLRPSFVITEELSEGEDTDTSRLLASGAKRVYGLWVREDCLEEGAQALLNTMNVPVPIVCLSNSLRTVVDPALFLMSRRQEENNLTESARRVADHADRIVAFNENHFGLALDDLDLVEGLWILREDAAAIILAGGNSTRMRQDKSRLCVRDRPLIEHLCLRLEPHFRQILISSRQPGDFAYPGIAAIPDLIPGMGPLMGIASALEASRFDRNFMVACDMPDFDIRGVRAVLRAANGCDIAAATTDDGLSEPLFAVWRKSAMPAITETLRAGERSVRKVFPRCAVKRVPIDPKQLGHNLNTPQDYAEFLAQETRNRRSP